MRPQIDVRRYFTADTVAPILMGERSPVDTMVFDEFFRDQADTWPFTRIGIRDLLDMARAQPLTLDGTESVAVGRGRFGADGIKPEPFALNAFMSAEEINAMRGLPLAQTRQDVANSHIRTIRDDLRVSINGLSAQAISTGKISWPIKVSAAGFETFEIDFTEFGDEQYSIMDVRPEKDLTALTGVKASDWVEYVDAIEDQYQSRGLSAPGAYRLGRNAWKGLMNVASSTKVTDSVKVVQGVEQTMIPTPEGQPPRYRNQSYIDVGGHRFYRYAYQYEFPNVVNGLLKREYRRVVADDNIHAVSQGVAMQFRYLSISDLDIDFAALPLALKTIESKDPSGEKILGQSRPLPIPIVKAILNCPAKPLP